MNYIPLLYCQKGGLWSVLLLGWKSVDGCGKIVSESSILAYKWLFWLLLLYSSRDYEQALRGLNGKTPLHYAIEFKHGGSATYEEEH